MVKASSEIVKGSLEMVKLSSEMVKLSYLKQIHLINMVKASSEIVKGSLEMVKLSLYYNLLNNMSPLCGLMFVLSKTLLPICHRYAVFYYRQSLITNH